MRTNSLIRSFFALAGALALLSVAGCKTYKADVTLRPDGTGKRTVSLQVETDQDTQGYLAPDLVRRLFRLSEDRGWRALRNEEGTINGFQREVDIAEQQDWHAQSGDISIRSSLDDRQPVDQGMTNLIVVETGQETGGRSYVYRERFVWTGIKEAITGFVAEHFRAKMAALYPRLSAEAQAELRGLMSGHLSLAWPNLFENDDTGSYSDQIEALNVSVTSGAADIVRRELPGTDLTPIGRLVGAILEDEENELEDYLEQRLPGFDQALMTDIEIQIVMPGEIVETNAEQVEGAVARWEFSPADAMKSPLEIFARSVLAR